MSRTYPAIVDFIVPRKVRNPTVSLAASGSTFQVQLLTHDQRLRFIPLEPPPKPDEGFVRRAPHPRFWESPLVKSIVREMSLPYLDDWYFVFQNPPESKEENSIKVEIKLTTTKIEPPPSYS